MPKGSKKSKARSGQQTNGQSAVQDFTVYHFANADPSSAKTGRMSKAVTTWSSQVKQLSEATPKDDTAWYDKDLTEFDSFLDSDGCSCEEEDEEEGTDTQEYGNSTPKHKGRRKRKTGLMATSGDDGAVYPLDLWFLVGDWVCPEDVSTFARICRASHFVVHSARFWYTLYRRCYNSVVTLPETLQPQSMERVHGLRDRVIRALYIMYEPFQHRLKTRSAFEQDPDALKGATCILMWHQNVKALWHFFFKFSLPHNDKFTCPLIAHRSGRHRRHQNPLLQDANIHHNPECRYCVLQVVTQHYTPVAPCVMGQTLIKTALSLSHGMRHHKLRLIFTPQQYTPQGGNSSAIVGGTTVILDPVLNAYVLHWWDPKYPHQPV